MPSFEEMLTGGHPNSLGRTIEVVEIICQKPKLIEELYQCYFSNDEVVRLRTSNAFKRLADKNVKWVSPLLDGFITKISKIDQASTQWTLAQLFLKLEDFLSKKQREGAIAIMQNNLAHHNDWIVLNQTMKTLATWAKEDDSLKKWLKPILKGHMKDKRNSVAKTASKYSQLLY